MHRSALAPLLAATGLTAAASAQPTWTTQIGFAQTSTGPLLPGNTFSPTATGTYTFYVRAGIFNLSGLQPDQSNQGVARLFATVAATHVQPGDGLGFTNVNARIAPFNFGPPGGPGPVVHPDLISQFLASRELSGGATAMWPFGQPQPTGPTPGALGVNSLTNIFRFTYTITSLPVVTDITVSGSVSPVLRWSVFSATEPDPEAWGTVNFLGFPAQPEQPFSPATLLIRAIPTPGTAAIPAAALGLAMTRRRRAPRPSRHIIPRRPLA